MAEIDKNFMTAYQKVATHDGEDEPIQIWAKDSDAYGGVGTDKLGIWGSVVAVDFDICVADGACIEACLCCGKGDYEFLDGRGAGRAASLCGRHAVQLARREARGDVAIDLEALALKLQSHGHVKVNQFLLRLDWKEGGRPYELTLFKDGRAIVKGTDDISVARGLFNRYIGG